MKTLSFPDESLPASNVKIAELLKLNGHRFEFHNGSLWTWDIDNMKINVTGWSLSEVRKWIKGYDYMASYEQKGQEKLEKYYGGF